MHWRKAYLLNTPDSHFCRTSYGTTLLSCHTVSLVPNRDLYQTYGTRYSTIESPARPIGVNLRIPASQSFQSG